MTAWTASTNLVVATDAVNNTSLIATDAIAVNLALIFLCVRGLRTAWQKNRQHIQVSAG